MICVEWIDKFNLGIPEIDAQHQELIRIMNGVCQSLNQGREEQIIGESLKAMQGYALTHFALEEKYFEEFHYERAELHKQWHRTFTEKVQELIGDLERDPKSVSIDTIAFLGGWFIDHTQKMDREYVALFHEHGL